MTRQRLVLFDFDGTITTKDTFLEFIKYHSGIFSFYLGFMLNTPFLILYKLKLIPNWRAKEIILTYFFKEKTVASVEQTGKDFCEKKLPQMIRPKALSAIEEHLNKGDRVLVISASSNLWIERWCQQVGLELIATQLEVIDEKLTGKIKGKNCYGEEKVERLKSVLDLSKYTEIIAYGDSSGDKAMLNIASKKYYRPFRQSI